MNNWCFGMHQTEGSTRCPKTCWSSSLCDWTWSIHLFYIEKGQGACTSSSNVHDINRNILQATLLPVKYILGQSWIIIFKIGNISPFLWQFVHLLVSQIFLLGHYFERERSVSFYSHKKRDRAKCHVRWVIFEKHFNTFLVSHKCPFGIKLLATLNRDPVFSLEKVKCESLNSLFYF